jgi:hypothetical protein
MRQLIYALRFRGEAKRVGVDGNVLKTATSAPSCTISSRIEADGLIGRLCPASGEEATLESELIFTGETTFQEAGTISFGTGGHQLRFSSVGSGHLGAREEAGPRHGAAIWRVDGGIGQFAGATGLIVSNVFLNDLGEVTDHHLGIVFVRHSGDEAQTEGV